MTNLKIKGVISGKAGKTAALPQCSDTLTLYQPEWGRLPPTIGFASPKNFRDCALEDN